MLPRAIVPAAALVPRPDEVDAVSGAAVWMPYVTAYGAMVEVGRVRAGDVVVLNAASSSVGLAAIHTANRLGAVAGPGVTELAATVAADGTLFLWGAQSGQPTPYPGFHLGMPALNVRTYTLFEITKDPQRMRRAAAFVTSGLRSGAFRPVVDRLFRLDEIVQAHRHMESNTQFGKIVVTVAH